MSRLTPFKTPIPTSNKERISGFLETRNIFWIVRYGRYYVLLTQKIFRSATGDGSGSMDQFHQVNHSSALNPPKDGLPSTQSSNDALRQMGSEGKMGAVHEEMKRVSRLPPSSAYATHRMRVLNKILQLLSIQRTTSQDEELELLFSGLSLG
ncbi:hypothetical protein KY290_011656 [Solanum tuberosum]|uniref:Uncharacterized protein n=2 Tax=Solanum TaxID=4107 RepID=A0ABQ7W1A2_SOLTU|nr:hypothetical protein KY290_011656 [Solanum tuberosum]